MVAPTPVSAYLHSAAMVAAGVFAFIRSCICYLIARPFLPAFAWALALAVVGRPLDDWITRRLRHRNWAAALAVAKIAVAVVAPGRTCSPGLAGGRAGYRGG